MRPLIGITAYEEQAHWNQWDDRAALLPARYVRAVEQAGGTGVLIPVQVLSETDASELVTRFDGIILTGGPDISPALYGAVAHEMTGEPRSGRDATEVAVCKASCGQRPLLAICRGMQLLNVSRGGTLHQHLPDIVGNQSHAPVKDGYGAHAVKVQEGSLLSSLIGTLPNPVPTHHHQAVDELGAGLIATASTPDGIVEAIEDPSLPFLLGVQWHPEAGEDPRLFEGLVAAARCSS